MIHIKFHSILQKKGQENGTETRLLAQKCIMEKTHLKFCYIYITMQASHQKMRFLYRNGFILETSYMYG